MINIKGYENKYYLDVNGNVYRYVIKSKSFKQLKPMASSGYLAVDLGLNGVIKRHLVHRLMAVTFIENHNNKPQVNHINGHKTDNRLINLEWCTASENQKHSIKLGLRSAKGEKNSQSKLTLKQVLQIRNEKITNKEIAAKYNISYNTICDIKSYRTWKT